MTKIKFQDLTIYSGGAFGSDYYWGQVAQHYGVPPSNIKHLYYREKTPFGNTEISAEQYFQGFACIQSICKLLKRQIKQERTKYLLARNYQQVVPAEQIFAIGNIIDNFSVSGGTGWAVELVKHYFPEDKQLYVYDLVTDIWYIWDFKFKCFMEYYGLPIILSSNIACIGTRNIGQSRAYHIMDPVFYNTRIANI